MKYPAIRHSSRQQAYLSFEKMGKNGFSWGFDRKSLKSEENINDILEKLDVIHGLDKIYFTYTGGSFDGILTLPSDKQEYIIVNSPAHFVGYIIKNYYELQ